MDAVYTLRKDVITDDAGSDKISYGINAYKYSGELSEAHPNLFCDKQKAVEFITLCNAEQLELTHLKNVLADFKIL